MDDQQQRHLQIIPNFSKYGIDAYGDVYRLTPASRGRTAGKSHKVTPVIHPKGHLWSVQLTDDSGKRFRIPVKKLVAQVFGKTEFCA